MKYLSAGYEALIKHYQLDVVPNWHRSYISVEHQTHHINKEADGSVREIYPARYRPGESVGEQLEFALKYDGVNLGILSQIFTVIDINELLEYLRAKPTGKYVRRIWYFYEYLTQTRLPLDDLKQGNYVDLLESNRYYTLEKGDAVKRQRIRDNLLGVNGFCPIVLKTQTLRKMEEEHLDEACDALLSEYPVDVLKRALSYLYTKETKSSFAIEHEEISTSRSERFVALLKEAQKEDFCQKDRLIELQNRIVDPRFADKNYRTSQNYVGEALALGYEKVHYISPKPEDLPKLMEGLITCHKRMQEGKVHPIVHAAVIAYGFVFLHPFEDGNGRIHRFLIHNILATRSFSPAGVIFPVSAVMLKETQSYDASLEAFSDNVVKIIDYTLDEEGKLTVQNKTAKWYKYIDMTAQVEALYRFVVETIKTELPEELSFLAGYDEAKQQIKDVVDMPDRLVNLFIRFVLQNHGKLSKSKKEKYFNQLTSDEIDEMEKIVTIAFNKKNDR